MLSEMGFEGNAARAALQAVVGDVEQAISRLTEGGAPLVDVSSGPAAGAGGAAVGAAAAAAMARASAGEIPQLCEALSAVPGGGGALSLLRKLVGNVRDAPNEAKYRRVRLSNAKISGALGGRTEAYALLGACGFVLDGSGEHAEIDDNAAADAPSLEWACVCLDKGVSDAANGGPPVPEGPCDIKVLVAGAGEAMRFEEVGDDFYALTPAEVKAILDASAARRAKEERLMTREQREAERAKARRLYRKAMIRVRFPDDTVLQATFAASAPVSTLLTWVADSLRVAGEPFELAVPRESPLSELTITLEHAQLAPAAMLNFRHTGHVPLSPPYLHESLLAQLQQMTAEEIPRGYGGQAADGPMGASEQHGGRARADGPRSAPGWMRQQ